MKRPSPEKKSEPLGGICLERQVQPQLQEPRAPDGVLDDSQAALGWVRGRTFVVREEVHVVVWRIKTGMVEDIECIGLKAQANALGERKLLGQAHVKTHLERTPEDIPTRASVE